MFPKRNGDYINFINFYNVKKNKYVFRDECTVTKKVERMENYDKGRRFADLVASEFRKDKKFTVIDASGTYLGPRRTSEPDLQIQLNGTDIVFAVECVYREKIHGDTLAWASYETFDRYNVTWANMPNPHYFIVVGVGGEPENPERLFFGHFREFKYPSLYESIYKYLERSIKHIPTMALSAIRDIKI